tara:strand:- start:341 stop:1165 length:825 start_codon:yes stop_codon:yes gene_type:complete
MNRKKNKTDFSTYKVMGILNLTEDSFYDGGRYNNIEKILSHTKKMIDEGAHIIDIGAQSSRPGSEENSEKTELRKIIPTLKEIRKFFPNILISVDTYRSKIAEESINNGADIINDISAGDLDKNMFNIIAKYKVPYIIMHMKGTPKNMQKNPTYQNVVDEIINYFQKKIRDLNNLNIDRLIIDPGFGFGKTLEHNYEILNNLDKFESLNYPILTGFSRKSMISKILEIEADQAQNGTSILNTMALNKGASLLRVHDVKEAIECIKIVNFAKNKL